MRFHENRHASESWHPAIRMVTSSPASSAGEDDVSRPLQRIIPVKLPRLLHERAGLKRVVAVARETNIGSRQVLGSIGMVLAERFEREGDWVLVYESRWEAG